MNTQLADQVTRSLREEAGAVPVPHLDELAIRRRTRVARTRRVAGMTAAGAAAAAVVVAAVALGSAHGPARTQAAAPPGAGLGSIPILDNNTVQLLDLDTGAATPTKVTLGDVAELTGRVPGGVLAIDSESHPVRLLIDGTSVRRVAPPTGQPVGQLVVSGDGEWVSWLDLANRVHVRRLDSDRGGFVRTPADSGTTVLGVDAGRVVVADKTGVHVWDEPGDYPMGHVPLAGPDVSSAQLRGDVLAVTGPVHETGDARTYVVRHGAARPGDATNRGIGSLSPDGSSFAEVAQVTETRRGMRQADTIRIWHGATVVTTIRDVPNVNHLVWLNEHTVLIAEGTEGGTPHLLGTSAAKDADTIAVCDTGTGGCRKVFEGPGHGRNGSSPISAPLGWS
jgi:hypothetical protein